MHSSPIVDHPISRQLDKPPQEFTRQDLLGLIKENGIQQIAFHHVALDGKLKELKLPIGELAYAERILAEGERVDGSSLFPGLVETGRSDLYLVPLYRSAFYNPFDPNSLDFLCRHLTPGGELAPFTPDNILGYAQRYLEQSTGLSLHALGELEFYLLGNLEPDLYALPKQSSYHQAAPFLKMGNVLDEAINNLNRITGAVKYAHAEVGFIQEVESQSPEIQGKRAEQWEIEFLPAPIQDAADWLVLARWLIRNIAYRHQCVATFTPKLQEGIAGNGLHVHMKLMKGGVNRMTNKQGSLSESARKLIGGLCTFAPSLTAFGNTLASSYMRLVPNQEAPTRIFWSDCNRKAVVRVPLGWRDVHDLALRVNPQQSPEPDRRQDQQTVELRTPDGSAMVHFLFAGIALAVAWGLNNAEALQIAKQLYLGQNKPSDRTPEVEFPLLPESCSASARILQNERSHFQREGVFPPQVIDYVVRLLNDEQDQDLPKKLNELSAEEQQQKMLQILHRDLHRH